MVLALLHPFTQLSWVSWSIHPSTVIGLAGIAGLYFWRARRRKADEQLSSVRIASFLLALFVIFASLNGPLHDLSDVYLFSGHMVQHLLLTLAMPPLLIGGTPGWMIRPVMANRTVAAIARRLTRPMVCFAVFNLVMALWHVPAFYNAAMADHNVHIFEHLMFMSAAVLMWWPLTSQLPELPRLAYPGQMLYCFLMSIPMSIIAVYIVMSDRVLYPAYSSAPRLWGLSPMDDQMLGGLIMWIPGGLVFTLIMTVVFFKWAALGEDHAAAAQVDWKPSAA
ncbi:MAG: cytochrome c oxidase assembly protein [Gemmatimonadota bacterium]|nr:cytochrome c oxidase assembly protein [Gemmatimonadota bacterium]